MKKKCSRCGLVNWQEAEKCTRCKTSLSGSPEVAQSEESKQKTSWDNIQYLVIVGLALLGLGLLRGFVRSGIRDAGSRDIGRREAVRRQAGPAKPVKVWTKTGTSDSRIRDPERERKRRLERERDLEKMFRDLNRDSKASKETPKRENLQ